MKTDKQSLVVLDYDGVIVDSIDANVRIAAAACRKMGHACNPGRADIQALENIAFEDLGRQLGLTEDRLPDFGFHVFELIKKNDAPYPLFAGMARLIRELGEKNYLAIVTTNIKPAVLKALTPHGLADCIDLILGVELPGSKSDKIIQAARTFNVDPAATYMVGDAVSDIRQAHKAGVKSIAVTWGYHPKEKLARENPDFIADTPADIVAIVS